MVNRPALLKYPKNDASIRLQLLVIQDWYGLDIAADLH